MYNMTANIYKKIKKITIDVLKFFNPFDIFQIPNNRSQNTPNNSRELKNNNDDIEYNNVNDYRLLTNDDIDVLV